MSKTTFVDKDAAAGILGTIIKAEFLNPLNNHYHTGLNIDGHGALPYAADAGAANAYVVTLSPVLPQYIIGMPVYFKVGNTNTGAATLNINSLGTLTIKKQGNVDLLAGDIVAGQIVGVVYDGTNFQLLTPVSREQYRPGDIIISTLAAVPAGALPIAGATISRAAYAALFANAVPQQAVTISIASPGIFTTITDHGLVVGDRIRLATAGSLPTGLAVNTDYYLVSVPSSTTFTVAPALGGTAINTSGTQSGAHTMSIWRGYGPGDGSSTFQLPDWRGYALRLWDNGAGVDSGRVLGTKQEDEFKAHSHPAGAVTQIGMGGGDIYKANNNNNAPTGETGGTETRMKNAAVAAYIKY